MQTTPVFPSRRNSITNINDAVNEDLDLLKNWLESNKLSLNVSKTQSMVIGSRNRLKRIGQSENSIPALKIGEEPVSMVKHAKYLGVQVDQHLLWDEHLNVITKKNFSRNRNAEIRKKIPPITDHTNDVQESCRAVLSILFSCLG